MKDSRFLQRTQLRHRAAKQLSHLLHLRCIIRKCQSPKSKPSPKGFAVVISADHGIFMALHLQAHGRVAFPGSLVAGRDHVSGTSQSVTSTVTCGPLLDKAYKC